MIGREQEIRKYRDRAKYFNIFVLLAFSVTGIRLYHLQVVQGDELKNYSEANRLKKEKIFSPRGIIYDREGKVIVDNRASFDVVMLSQYYPFTKEVNSRLRSVLDMEQKAFEKRLKRAKRNRSFRATLIKADVSKDVIAGIEMDPEEFPGVYIEASVQRRYPYKDISAQVLGYVAEVNEREIKKYPERRLEAADYIGKVGLEKNFDRYLRGVDGAGYVEVDARGRRRRREKGEKLLGFEAYTDPVPGNDIYLTLDMDLSRTAVESMKKRDYKGSVVAVDPRNGEVLVMANLPSYDPTLISGREVSASIWASLSEDKLRPLRNRAIQDHYPPGSTFKLFVAAAGLAEAATTREHSVKCHGYMRLGRRRFHCWKRHGSANFIRSIKESCDIFFYRLGLDLGVNRMAQYARAFGMGAKTGINLPGEVPGLIPDERWKVKRFKEPWQKGENLSVAIGQGYVVATPLQMANAYAAIGNGGFVYKPQLVKKIVGRNHELIQETRPELLRRVEVPSEVFDAVKEGLYRVVNERGGTAWWHRSRSVGFSGKTGTAQVRRFKNILSKKCENLDYKERHHGWFVGYAPMESPQIAVAVIGEHICHGSSAAPVVRDVIDAYFEKHPIAESEKWVSFEPLQRPTQKPNRAPVPVVQNVKKVKPIKTDEGEREVATGENER